MEIDDLNARVTEAILRAAALSALEPLRALLLVDRYLAEGVSPEAAAKFEALRAEADAELAEVASKAPPVRPVKYTLQDAA